MHLVVGLGNPGHEYQDNRHNLGFMVVDELLRRGARLALRAKFGAEIAEVTLGGKRVLLCKPMEFMNVSGQAVAQRGRLLEDRGRRTPSSCTTSWTCRSARLSWRGRRPRRPQRHALDDRATRRPGLRAGPRAASAGRRPGRDAAGYVLADFSRAEAKELPDLRMLAADAVEAIVADGVARRDEQVQRKGSSSQKQQPERKRRTARDGHARSSLLARGDTGLTPKRRPMTAQEQSRRRARDARRASSARARPATWPGASASTRRSTSCAPTAPPTSSPRSNQKIRGVIESGRRHAAQDRQLGQAQARLRGQEAAQGHLPLLLVPGDGRPGRRGRAQPAPAPTRSSATTR